MNNQILADGEDEQSDAQEELGGGTNSQSHLHDELAQIKRQLQLVSRINSNNSSILTGERHAMQPRNQCFEPRNYSVDSLAARNARLGVAGRGNRL